MVCGNCKKEGHTRANCKKLGGICGRCGSDEHIDRETKVKANKKNNTVAEIWICRHDKYTPHILRRRFKRFKERAIEDLEDIKETGICFRMQNPPEDITENFLKFVIINHEGDHTVVWCRLIELPGDLDSTQSGIVEAKCFTSGGPSSFGPKKKFNVIYFIDMRNWLNDIFIVWKVNLTNDSDEWKNIQMNEEETNEQQCEDGRRAHISWEKIKSQLPPEKISQVYNGTFEGIFTAKPSVSLRSA
jgi:hypothetical protein